MPDTKQIKVNGRLITVPINATLDQIQELAINNSDFAMEYPAAVRAGIAEPPEFQDKVRYVIGRAIPSLLKAGGGTIGGIAGTGLAAVGAAPTFGTSVALPVLGATSGATAGSAAGALLQKNYPRIFGALPGGETSLVSDAITYGALPEIGGIALGNLFESGKAFVKGLMGPKAPSLSTALKAKVATNLQNIPAVSDKLAQAETSGFRGRYYYKESDVVDNLLTNTTKAANFNALPKSIAPLVEDMISGKGKVSNFAEEILSDVNKMRPFKAIDPTSVRQLTQNHIIDSAFNNSTQTLNAKKALDMLGGQQSEVLREAIGNPYLKGFEDLLREMNKSEGLAAEGRATLSYIKNRMTLALGGMIAGGKIGGATGSIIGGAGAVYLGEKGIERIMSDPEVSKLALQMMRTPASSPAASLLTRSLISSGLRGIEVTVSVPGDKLQKAYIDDNGQLVYEKPTNK